MRRASHFRYYCAFAFPVVLWMVWCSLVSPLAVSSVDLPWGDINIVAVTDVHSWVAGHAPHPHWSNDTEQTPNNADYGHVLSFYRQLQNQASEKNVDLFFVMNGDFMDGTGLSTIPPDHLLPLITCMPWDAVNLGNHELYHNETVEYMMDSGFIHHWRGNYLTSNVDVIDSSTRHTHTPHQRYYYRPLGNRYTYLYGTYTNTTILTFGFLYNFQGNCHNTRVRMVEQVVQEEWFQSVLEKGNFHAIMVLAHMDYRDALVTVILDAIREIVGVDMPVQFINGHSHVRGFQKLDENAVSFEPGHFLDTVGFASFSTRRPMMVGANQSSCLFQHVFLDANVKELQEAAHIGALSTPEGDALSVFIHETETALGLTDTIGCSPSTYYLQKELTDQKSLWRLFLRKVVPTQLFHLNASKVYIENTGAFRFDLFAGEVTLNDLIAAAPFQDVIYQVAERVSGRELNQVMDALNAGAGTGRLPHMVSSAEHIESDVLYDIFTADFDTSVIGDKIETITSLKQAIVPLLNERNESITTTLLWADFVRAEFPCRTAGADLYPWIVAGFIVCVALFFAWWWSLKQHLEGRGLDNKPPEQQDQCPLLDGNGAKNQTPYDAII
jgi:2',3'-cyclic-nucleotide 2'-phosphodiesterase (5'-nucleotidase family)